MEVVEQIKQICEESGNKWFLTHNFPQIALHDLKRQGDSDYEYMRNSEIAELVENYKIDIYDFDNEEYVTSKWIFSKDVEGNLQGFILIKCYGGDGYFEKDGFTHELYFALVREKYRKKGVLKEMINNIPKQWNIWLEAQSNEIDNVENIWEKCGFKIYKIINPDSEHNKHLIYQRLSSYFHDKL